MWQNGSRLCDRQSGLGRSYILEIDRLCVRNMTAKWTGSVEVMYINIIYPIHIYIYPYNHIIL